MKKREINAVMNALEIAERRIKKYLKKERLKWPSSSSTVEKLTRMACQVGMATQFLLNIRPEIDTEETNGK
ncbi:MAG: hypothetical protein O0W93_06220 [Methanocorpusculum sp.]|nr:hypothetical protein [Methanocorpusculum sp.]